uniref:Uncharacterized protein n=1 Tax=Kalanchoe fedtschenkoi TaxID=63787 RepID=A0A7N0TDT2_KALFE
MEEELKIIILDEAHSRDAHESHTSSPTTPPPPPPAWEPGDEDGPSVEDNNSKDDVLKTPTSAFNKIRPVFTCPPAPRKPKAAPLRKRKGLHRLLDMSNDVLSLYPPALLADFGNKLKKARRNQKLGEQQQQQQKENICCNIN